MGEYAGLLGPKSGVLPNWLGATGSAAQGLENGKIQKPSPHVFHGLARLAEREDEELVVMEAQERLESEIDARREQLGVETARLRAVIVAAEVQIDAELAGLVVQRSALIPPLAAAVLTVYEKLRGHRDSMPRSRQVGAK
jgi:hypothetical protein